MVDFWRGMVAAQVDAERDVEGMRRDHGGVDREGGSEPTARVWSAGSIEPARGSPGGALNGQP